MKLNEYLKIKNKECLKKKLFFLSNTISINSDNWLKTEQDLYDTGFTFSKTKISNKNFKNSTFKNIKEILNGPTFLIKPKEKTQLSRDVLLYQLCPLVSILLAVKINNKIYPTIVLKKNQSLIAYNSSNLLFYQFSTTSLKYNVKFVSK